MRDLPTGTVTFLFSDIEGSTRLAQELGPSVYAELLEQHHRLLRSAFTAHGGTERGTQGDAFLVIFRDAPSAVAAAAAAQRSLAGGEWPKGAEVRVRMGVHSGEGIAGGDDYVGMDINRAARIAAAGHGGQVLISDATRALCERSLPRGVSLREVGEHRLKDLDRPERLYQLVIEGLPSEFAPLRSLDRTVLLPAETTAFIGREAELGQITTLVGQHRLVTLTGPGGTGKTRLAIRAARVVADGFRDGAAFVALAAAASSGQIWAAAALTLRLREAPDRPIADVLRDFLREQQMLLVLDNLEQISDAHVVVADLLASSPGLRVLATSRGPLHLSGEQEFPVPPLATADPAGGSAEVLASSDAVRLFVDRARLVDPHFAPGWEELRRVAEICLRLDGLPLAIELAAARTRLFAPRAILERLGRRLGPLGGGPVDLPQRQRSLRQTIEWSHELLIRPERTLFRRLGVFVGGASTDAIEAVCADPARSDIERTDVPDALGGLADQSLVQRADREGETRFTMLETIREYASERLEESGEAAAVRARHAAYFLARAEEAERGSRGPEARALFARLEADLDNLRSIFTRALSGEDLEIGLRLAGSLTPFWVQRNLMEEARRVTDLLLAADGGDSIGRAAALLAGSELATWRADYGRARPLGEESTRMLRRVGDRPRLAQSLATLGFSMIVGDTEAALTLFDEAEQVLAELGSDVGIGSLELARGTALLRKGDLAAARHSAERSVRILEHFDEPYYLVFSVGMLGHIELALGARESGLAHLRRMVELAVNNGLLLALSVALDYCAAVALADGDTPRAVRLTAAADHVKERLGSGIPLSVIIKAVDVRAVARERLPAGEFAAADAAGRALTRDEAIHEALAAAR